MKNSLRSLRILKIFGFAAFTVENKKSVTKFSDLLYLAACFATGFIFLAISIKFRDEFATSSSEIADLGNFGTYVASIVIALISMLLTFFNRHKGWKVILQLSEADKIFKEIGFFKDYTKTAKIILAVVLSIMSLTVPLQVCNYFIEGSLLKAVLYFYSGLYLMLSVGSVVGLMNGVFLRFKTVNRVFQSLLTHKNGITAVRSNKIIFSDIELIRIIVKVYEDLMKAYNSINGIFGVQTMLVFGFLFFYTIFTSFMAFKDISSLGSLNGVTIASLLMSFYLNLFSSAVLYVCAMLENEAKKTWKLSNTILKSSSNPTEVAILMSFNGYMKRNSPKFTCKFFDFDWKLVYGVSCCSANVTDILIIVSRFLHRHQPISLS